MYYAITREFEIPFDNSIGAINIGQDVIDIVKANQNTGLNSISIFIIDDNNVLIKSDPRLEAQFKIEFEKLTKIKLQELLLG